MAGPPPTILHGVGEAMSINESSRGNRIAHKGKKGPRTLPAPWLQSRSSLFQVKYLSLQIDLNLMFHLDVDNLSLSAN
jgi:hypothetical protein